MSHNIDQIFPLLNREALSEHAGRWATDKKYSWNGHIFKITLHRYISDKTTYRYAVVCHLDFNQPGAVMEETEEIEIVRDLILRAEDITEAPSFKAVYKEKDGNPPVDCQREWFFFPKYQDEYNPLFIGTASWQLFPATDEKIEAQKESIPTTEGADDIKDNEIIIRSLQVSYVSDTEISVKNGKQQPKTYSYDKLGFGRDNTKAWRALMLILKSSDHSYHVGVAHGAGKVRNKSYDANQKILAEINKKLISLLKEIYNLQLPEKFQLFELKKGDHPGTYGPKFIVSNFNTKENHNGDLSKDTLIAEIEKLSARKAVLDNRGDEDSENELIQITENLQAKIMLAIKNNWLGQNRAASYLNPPAED